MKKRIVISIALLMILCLALTGCGQRDNNAGASQTNNSSGMGDPGDADNQENPTSVPDDSSDYDLGTNENPKKNEDGWYLYDVDGRQIALKTNIWDYIYDDGGYRVFDAIKMAEDLGWEWADKDRTDIDTSTRGPEWRIRFRLESYSGDFDRRQKHVEFGNSRDHVYDISTSFDVITFDRLDVENGDTSNAFYLNAVAEDASTVNIEQIIVTCYLFERTTEDSDENPLIAGGIYGYHPIHIHK